MPIGYSVILTAEERATIGGLVDSNSKLGVRGASKSISENLKGIYPSGTIVYSDGSKHNIKDYSEMLVATTIIDAEREATLEFVKNNPTDLVMVTVEGSSHPGCAIWEGFILSVSGSSNDYPSLDVALGADGLFHPRCAHSIDPVYTDLLDKDKGLVKQNLQTVSGNLMRSAGAMASADKAIIFLDKADALLDGKYKTDFKTKTLKNGDVKVIPKIKAVSGGEVVVGKETTLHLLDKDTELEEFDIFYDSPFRDKHGRLKK